MRCKSQASEQSGTPLWRHAMVSCMLLTCANLTLAQSLTLPLVPDHWQELLVSDDIHPNRFTFETEGDQSRVRIDSKASMSMLASSIEVDLTQTPFLCWNWRINRVIKAADMNERLGDDYAARLYLSVAIAEDEKSLPLKIELGLARSIWGPEVPDGAINYVWDNRQPVGTTMPNAYTDRVSMLVVQSGSDRVGQWVQQARNVAQDIEQFFPPSTRLKQIALAADTDNTGEAVVAEFAEIRFVANESQCR